MLDRGSPPAFNEISEFHLIQPTSHKLGNGVPIHIINIAHQPVIKLELIIPAGQWYEPDAGISFFALKMLSEGTEQRSAKNISNHFDKYGAFLELNPGLDHIAITLYTLSKYLNELIPVLAEIIYQPTFPASELETLLEVKRQKVKVDQEKSSYVASRKFRELLFGVSHPYGAYLQEKHLDTIGRESLIKYHKQYIPGLFEIIISGNLEPSSISVIEKYFGK
ncbi:MAG: M16 family metallopeptidase, partial [Cyclobacteriaceae bacterium]